MVVFRKENARSVFICRLIKKSIMVIKKPMGKADSNFDFFQAAYFLWGFNKKECYVVHISFYTKRA